MQSLDLWNTQVRDVTPLAGLTALQRLDLPGPNVTGLALLRKRNPELTIVVS